MVVHTFHPNTWEAKAGGSLWGQPVLQRESQDNQGYTEKEKRKQNKELQNLFLKKLQIYHSFWRLKIPRQAVPCIQPLVRAKWELGKWKYKGWWPEFYSQKPYREKDIHYTKLSSAMFTLAQKCASAHAHIHTVSLSLSNFLKINF